MNSAASASALPIALLTRRPVRYPSKTIREANVGLGTSLLGYIKRQTSTASAAFFSLCHLFGLVLARHKRASLFFFLLLSTSSACVFVCGMGPDLRHRRGFDFINKPIFPPNFVLPFALTYGWRWLVGCYCGGINISPISTRCTVLGTNGSRMVCAGWVYVI